MRFARQDSVIRSATSRKTYSVCFGEASKGFDLRRCTEASLSRASEILGERWMYMPCSFCLCCYKLYLYETCTLYCIVVSPRKYSLRSKISVSTLIQLCTRANTKLRHLFWDGGSKTLPNSTYDVLKNKQFNI